MGAASLKNLLERKMLSANKNCRRAQTRPAWAKSPQKYHKLLGWGVGRPKEPKPKPTKQIDAKHVWPDGRRTKPLNTHGSVRQGLAREEGWEEKGATLMGPILEKLHPEAKRMPQSPQKVGGRESPHWRTEPTKRPVSGKCERTLEKGGHRSMAPHGGFRIPAARRDT